METIIKCLNEIVNGQKIGANSVICLYSKTVEQILNILADEASLEVFLKKILELTKSFIFY